MSRDLTPQQALLAAGLAYAEAERDIQRLDVDVRAALCSIASPVRGRRWPRRGNWGAAGSAWRRIDGGSK